MQYPHFNNPKMDGDFLLPSIALCDIIFVSELLPMRGLQKRQRLGDAPLLFYLRYGIINTPKRMLNESYKTTPKPLIGYPFSIGGFSFSDGQENLIAPRGYGEIGLAKSGSIL